MDPSCTRHNSWLCWRAEWFSLFINKPAYIINIYIIMCGELAKSTAAHNTRRWFSVFPHYFHHFQSLKEAQEMMKFWESSNRLHWQLNQSIDIDIECQTIVKSVIFGWLLSGPCIWRIHCGVCRGQCVCLVWVVSLRLAARVSYLYLYDIATQRNVKSKQS